MKDRHQAAYIPFRCSGETGQLIGRLAAQQHRPRSEVLRDLVERGLVSVGVKSDEDYLSGLVRQTVEETAKPHVERLAAISAKAAHIAAASFSWPSMRPRMAAHRQSSARSKKQPEPRGCWASSI